MKLLGKNFFFCLVSLMSLLYGAVEKMPYLLFEGENTKMTVMWQMTSTEECTITWGKDKNYSMGTAKSIEYSNEHQHRYTISNLEPNTLYYYDISGVGAGSFRTSPMETAKEVKFLAYGDTRTYPDDHNLVAEQMLKRISDDEMFQTAVLFSGDYVGQGGNEEHWASQFFPTDQPHIVELHSKIPNIGSIGNHEGGTGANVLKKYYPFPFVDGHYWAYDYGPVRVFVIDQITESYDPGSAQYNWLESELVTCTKEWKIAVFHKPAYSAGGSHENNYKAKSYLQPLFEEYGVDFVINGDNHYYSRAEVNGVQHITTGGGGAPLYNPDKSYPSIVSVDKSHHFMEFHIKDNKASITARRVDGTIIESFSVSHGAVEPELLLSKPVEGSIFEQGAEVTFSATAKNGSPDKVLFYADGINIGDDESAPYSIDWLAPNENTKIKVYATADFAGNIVHTDTVTITITEKISDSLFTVESRIQDRSDDAEEDASGAMYLASTDLELLDDDQKGRPGQVIGLRFSNLKIPKGVTIKSAQVVFTCDETDNQSGVMTINGEASNNAVTFSKTTNNISNREMTSNSVAWTPDSWTTVGATYETPNIGSVIQEIVDRPGWQEANSICLIFTGSGKRVAESFDGDALNAPLLKVQYEMKQTDAIIQETAKSKNNKRFAVYPNPVSTSESEVSVFIPGDIKGNAVVVIYDVVGNIIDSKELSLTGESTLKWDLTNRAGLRVTEGTYLIQVGVSTNGGDYKVLQSLIGVKAAN